MRKSLLEMMKALPNLKVIGLTATPFHAELPNYFSSVTNVITMGELVDQGFLVPFRVFASTEIDTKGVKVTAGEWQKDQLEERGLQIVGDVVADYIKIYTQVWGEPRKTICFSSGVAHGAELVKKFAEHGLNFVQISYLDDEDYKSDVLKEFAKPDTNILGVISTDILTRGFDQPDVEHVIIAKPLRKSFSQHVQMVGRGARTYDGKSFCVIQDNSGNWLRFRDSFTELYHDGVKSLDSDADKKTRKEPTDKEKKQSCCQKCKTIWPTAKTDLCPTCGFMRERRSNIEAIAGQMGELEGFDKAKEKKEKFTIEYKTDFYAQLRQYAKERNYQDGWAAHKYREKFLVWPSMAKPEPKTYGKDVLNFMTFYNIKNNKRRA
jgi:DNA repair protein RadD